jgi:integrase
MPNIRIPLHNVDIEARKKMIEKWKISEQDKRDLLIFLEDLSLGKVNKGNKVAEARQAKYLYTLKIPLSFFKVPTAKLNLKDVEDFEKALTSDKIKSAKGTPFTNSSKADIRKALRTYLKWKLKEKAIPLTDWFDTKVPRQTPEYLTEQEIEKLYKNCKNIEDKFLIAVLFDSGARAEEFHNIRFEDIQLPKEKDSFVKITLKEEYSKTKGRVISLYWKYSLEAINDYLEERKKQGIKMSEPVFANKYDNARQILVRLGKKVLNKSLHYHLFRHSSATYYAPKLNRQELCYRYGWAFSSDMPDVYISRAGMENKQLDEKFTQTELSELQTKLLRQEQSSKIMQETLQKQIEQERLDKELIMGDLKKQIQSEINEKMKEQGEKKKAQKKNQELTKEVDWDDMVFRRMVEKPELAPKIAKAMKKVWEQMAKAEELKVKSR